jgi:hypothetical protein
VPSLSVTESVAGMVPMFFQAGSQFRNQCKEKLCRAAKMKKHEL